MAEPTSTAVGPYILQDLVDDLPLDTLAHQNVTITCLESWGNNLYVGTSAHEILHLVSIPATPNPASPKPVYIQASRLEPQSSPTTSGQPFIKQIFVLPTVSKALVLSSTGLLTFYTLPEFSPAFKGTKLKEVSYVGGLNLNEEEADQRPGAESSEGRPKLVMALAKSRIRMIRIGEELRLVKDIPLSNTLSAVRRDSIACVATNQNYNMLDIDNIQRIPLFPISTASDPDLPAPPVEPPAEPPTEPPAEEASEDSSSQLHPPRASSLAVRERRNSSATVTREGSTAVTHNRSVSAGNIPPGGSERGSRRPTSRLGQSHLTPDSGTPRTSSPAPPTGRRRSQSRGSRVSSPAPPPPPPKSPEPRGALKPHIASPSPGEFLLTTGTTPEDPGVGIFVNMEGDGTRGTIQFERYPDQLIVQGGWVIAVIHGKGLDMQRWDLEDESSLDEADKKGTIPLEGEVQLQEVLGLDGTIVADAGRTLRLVRVPLKPVDGAPSESPADQKRNEEERVIAQRISTVQSRVVVFAGPKVWTLLPCPLSVRLNSRLPNFSDENFDGILARVRRVLHVLHEVQSMEPDSETSFHEVSFVRQKCGLLVLGELLKITQKQTADITADEILKVEVALIESALDPRFIVALFGNAFEEDIVEGDGGVWVYGGVKEVFMNLKESKEVGSAFTRDVLLLLKRVADEKEVFSTVDAAMLRVLLMLDSEKYLVDRGQTVVPEGNVRAELYAFIDAGVDDIAGTASILETFGRLYVLSILYSKAKMFRGVLDTWRRILDGEDTSGEFENGEVRVKNYLLKMRDPELVEEFGCWLATRNAVLGIQVFAAEEARVKFETAKVLEMLRARAPEAVRPYVEYLVLEKKNTAHANELIFLYLDDLTHTLSVDPSAVTALQTSYESYRALHTPKPTYHEFIVDNSPAAGSEPWWHNRMRLLELLGGASGYDIAQVSESIKQYREILVPEMVILYGRESKHTDALKLLTHDLRDFDTAINYCLFGGLSIFQTRNVITDRAEQSELFAVLLDEYLKLKNMNERIEQTSQLLEKFGRWLDVTHVLSVIPDDWSIDIVGGFLITALRQLVREKAEAKIERAIGRSKNLRVEAEFVRQCDEIGPVVDLGN
ncbi:hypothetical protein BZA05DRAFT_386775 [Tricharina praecox]|uniref:uncharacterized protein n=1 Tax=Tricharina praecox TaxID=43433 RepID=UPI0022209FFA|nr:uncharacterized protein BZA05DRAFT_386775 [Tricharina praecox]KAI5856954.1 hypothetical protein BZA05DRAFT_386775 [Tricharina praecox]